MKVEFLKDHVNNSTGDVVDLDDNAARYLVAVGVAKETDAKEKKTAAPAPKAKAEEPAKEKRAVKDMDVATAVEKVKDQKPGTKKKDSGPLEPVVNVEPDKNEVVNSTIETSEK